MDMMMAKTQNGLYSPLTKSIDIEESLALITLANEYEQVDAWQDEALFRLPQTSRSRRQEIVRDVQRKFLQVENDHFVATPLQRLLTWPALGERLKRDLLFAQYLRTTPLVWAAIEKVVLPHAEAASQPMAQAEAAEIQLEHWVDFLSSRLSTDTKSTVVKTRQHITAHLTKFGLLETRAVPGDRIAQRFFARFYEPDPRAFWFSLAIEFAESGWSSRSLDYIMNDSWTRVAYCTKSTYARFAIEEAERAALVMTEYFGSDRQIMLRGADPVTYIAEAILYG
jgi:hypothetical protein